MNPACIYLTTLHTSWVLYNSLTLSLINYIDSTQIASIEAGLRLLENSTKIGDKYCVKIVPRTTERDYVRVYAGGGCSSYIGRIGYEQVISLKKPTPGSSSTCLTSGIV